MKVLRIFTAALIASLAAPVQATVHDHLFVTGFDIPADAPATQEDAIRFLTQATFGPTASDVQRVMALGVGEWIDEQLAMPATIGYDTVLDVVNAKTAAGQHLGQSQRINRWLWQATYAPDQLRQRMAFALSQIFVVSDQNSMIGNDIVPMTSYYDLLIKHAFDPYRTVLDVVTKSPTMGKYLNAFHNIKPTYNQSHVQTTSPDENYAREVMQLFSIGLIELNLDGSPNGANVPTYDQTVITHTAKVFTGFTYSDAQANGSFYQGGNSYATASAQMACWGTELFQYDSTNMKHDITDDNGDVGPGKNKTVLDGQTIPSGQTCAEDVKAELDIISKHQNVAPFIARLLIQRFVTSNPSPGYISFVATTFKNSGGDLGDTVKAVLTYTDARVPPSVAVDPFYGKLREPLLRLTAVWRIFNAIAPPKDATSHEIVMNTATPTGGGTNFQGSFGQGPLESPTVFNFYAPDYQQPGVFAGAQKNSPEFQITSEATLYSMVNTFYNYTAKGYQGVSGYTNDRPLIVLDPLMNTSTNPPSVAPHDQIINYINKYMLYGTMSAGTQSALQGMIDFGLNGAGAYEVAWSSIYVTMMSPEFATQR